MAATHHQLYLMQTFYYAEVYNDGIDKNTFIFQTGENSLLHKAKYSLRKVGGDWGSKNHPTAQNHDGGLQHSPILCPFTLFDWNIGATGYTGAYAPGTPLKWLSSLMLYVARNATERPVCLFACFVVFWKDCNTAVLLKCGQVPI